MNAAADVPASLRNSRLTALWHSIALSTLFLIVYSSCNALTARRANVPSYAFAWEKHIPFVPIFIIPYMSIDLFFISAPFVCANRLELRLLSRRIIMAILVAGLCFLAMPMRFSFVRPAVGGWLGVIFNHFRQMDLPYNEFPSLHIALRTILADLYSRHARGVWRVLSAVWFSLIGCSTLLVYQHHVIDVIGGFILATICFYAIRPAAWRLATSGNRRVGMYYAIGAVFCAVIAIGGRPWTLIFLWPTMALTLVSLGYFGLGAAIYRKADGLLPLSSRILLAPFLLAQELSRRHYARQSDAWNAITPNIWLGRALSRHEASVAVDQGVTSVLDLTGEFSSAWPHDRVVYQNMPVLDLTAPLPRQLDEAADFIESHARRGIVYVHCKAGYSRSAAALGAYLLRSGGASSPELALDQMRMARPGIMIRPEIIAGLSAYAKSIRAGNAGTSDGASPN